MKPWDFVYRVCEVGFGPWGLGCHGLLGLISYALGCGKVVGILRFVLVSSVCLVMIQQFKVVVLFSSCDAWLALHSQFSSVGSDHDTLIIILTLNFLLSFPVLTLRSSLKPFHSFPLCSFSCYPNPLHRLIAFVSDCPYPVRQAWPTAVLAASIVWSGVFPSSGPPFYMGASCWYPGVLLVGSSLSNTSSRCGDLRAWPRYSSCALLLKCMAWLGIPGAGLLGLMGREPARQTSEPGSNPSWNATVHPVCETFNVMHVV